MPSIAHMDESRRPLSHLRPTPEDIRRRVDQIHDAHGQTLANEIAARIGALLGAFDRQVAADAVSAWRDVAGLLGRSEWLGRYRCEQCGQRYTHPDTMCDGHGIHIEDHVYQIPSTTVFFPQQWKCWLDCRMAVIAALRNQKAQDALRHWSIAADWMHALEQAEFARIAMPGGQL